MYGTIHTEHVKESEPSKIYYVSDTFLWKKRARQGKVLQVNFLIIAPFSKRSSVSLWTTFYRTWTWENTLTPV